MVSSCALSEVSLPRKLAQGVMYNYIRRFLPTLGEVWRVDTTEAQSLSNWIEIVKGRDRREARANHPTSRHYAGDKLTSSGLVKAMCVEALCQVVPCDKRDCEESCCLSRGTLCEWPSRTLTRPGNERCMV